MLTSTSSSQDTGRTAVTLVEDSLRSLFHLGPFPQSIIENRKYYHSVLDTMEDHERIRSPIR